jgi:hypothetical protein
MLHYLDPSRVYTNRDYLNQWIQEPILVITDNDFENLNRAQELLDTNTIHRRVYDITHNPYPDHRVPETFVPLLTGNFNRWYTQKPGHVFFPIFLWMFSCRNPQWWQPLCFDADSNKTKEIMCLNSNARSHRTQLWAELNRRQIIHKIVYSFKSPCLGTNYDYPYPLILPNDYTHNTDHSMGVEHPVYSECAVNIVNETSTEVAFITEKTCKPFLARQIPILVASVGINQFLQDIGLDMFSDLVPWQTWDSEPQEQVRVEKIAEFVDCWIRSGNILTDYQRMLPRIEKNKTYFHSKEFVELIMQQMYLAKL